MAVDMGDGTAHMLLDRLDPEPGPGCDLGIAIAVDSMRQEDLPCPRLQSQHSSFEPREHIPRFERGDLIWPHDGDVVHADMQMRGMAREFQGHLDQALKETGFDEVKKEFDNIKNPANFIDPATVKKNTEDATKKQVDDFKKLFGDVPAADAPTATIANMFCWGQNTYGQTGTGTTMAVPKPTSVKVRFGSLQNMRVTAAGIGKHFTSELDAV